MSADDRTGINPDTVTIVAHVHPFQPSSRILKEELPGRSLASIVRELVPHRVGRIIVVLNGEKVEEGKREFLKTEAGDHVVIRVVPAGTQAQAQGAAKSGFWMAAGGFALLFVPGMLPFGLALMAGGVLLGAGGVIAGAAYQGRVQPKKDDDIFSVRGGSNQMAPWGKIPVVIGKHLVVPYYAGRPYTSIDGTNGEDQYIHQLFCIGYGPLRLSSFKIGESLLATNAAAVRNGAVDCTTGLFTDVTCHVYQDGTQSSLYPLCTLEDSPNLQLDYNVEHWLTTPPLTTNISVDITLPRGLYQYDSDGAVQNHSVTVVVKRRAVGSGTAWASCTTVGTFTLTKALNYTLRYSVNEAVSADQYEVGVMRTTTDDADDFRGTSMVEWTAFRSKAADEPVHDDVRASYVFVALKIKATDQLNGIISQFNVVAEAEVPDWDEAGSGDAHWVDGFAVNPAAAFLWLLRGPMNPDPIPNASIDWGTIEAWWTTCDTAGWTCNGVLSSGERLRDTLGRIAQTGRASLTLRDGLYSVVVDEAKTTEVQHFTPKNVRNFQWTKSFAQMPHALKVNWINADDGWSPNEEIVYDDGYSAVNATRFEQVSLWGVTDKDLVWKWGRYRLAVARLRPEVYTFETDAEGLVCEPGDLVVVSHDAIVVGHYSGRIKSVTLDGGGDCTSVTIDELVTMVALTDYGLRFRRPDGESIYEDVTTVEGETSTLTFATPIPAADIPAVGDLYTFGEKDVETSPCLVVGVEALEDLGVRIHVVDEAPAVHTADSGVIPAYTSRVSRPPQVDPVQIVYKVAQNEQRDAPAENATHAVHAPQYKGRYDYVTPPTNPRNLDTCVLVSGTDAECGLYEYDEPTTTWNKLTAPTTEQIAKAWPDICEAVDDGYADEAEYCGTGVNFLEAFIGRLFAQYIKVLTGGSIRGGDRYDATGTEVDPTALGFFLASNGGCKVNGLSGTLGGSELSGLYWSTASKIGSDYTGFPFGLVGCAALSPSRIAWFEDTDQDLKMLSWNGATLSDLGNALAVAATDASLCRLSASRVVMVDGGRDLIAAYDFDGTDFSLHSSQALTLGDFPSVAALASNKIAIWNNGDSKLYTYSLSGTTWSSAATAFEIAGVTTASICALNATTILLADGTTDTVKALVLDGSTWSVEDSISVTTAYPKIASLTATEAFLNCDTTTGIITYSLGGLSFLDLGMTVTGTTNSMFTAISSTDLVFFHPTLETIFVVRLANSTSKPFWP